MHTLTHALFSIQTVFAVVITAGVAVLLFCCMGCSGCPCKEKDDIFRHHSA